MPHNIAIIGFGEAGSTFAQAAEWGDRARIFDVAPSRYAAMAVNGEMKGIPASTAAEALMDAALVLSLVTADQALAAARDYAPLLAPGAIWCDMNSVSPDTKRMSAQAIEAFGRHYVDVAVLAPVNPARLAVPLLLSGPAAVDAKNALDALGFTHARVIGSDVGQASTVKMVRSIMVKGIEALTDEMMAAARAGGVEGEVLASLDASEKSQGWVQKADYNLERMATHGVRRAAEMEEVAKTLLALGVDPVMTRGIVLRQRQAGEYR